MVKRCFDIGRDLHMIPAIQDPMLPLIRQLVSRKKHT